MHAHDVFKLNQEKHFDLLNQKPIKWLKRWGQTHTHTQLKLDDREYCKQKRGRDRETIALDCIENFPNTIESRIFNPNILCKKFGKLMRSLLRQYKFTIV